MFLAKQGSSVDLGLREQLSIPLNQLQEWLKIHEEDVPLLLLLQGRGVFVDSIGYLLSGELTQDGCNIPGVSFGQSPDLQLQCLRDTSRDHSHQFLEVNQSTLWQTYKTLRLNGLLL